MQRWEDVNKETGEKSKKTQHNFCQQYELEVRDFTGGSQAIEAREIDISTDNALIQAKDSKPYKKQISQIVLTLGNYSVLISNCASHKIVLEKSLVGLPRKASISKLYERKSTETKQRAA